MLPRGRELLWAFVAILLITLLYASVVFSLGSVPQARSFFGHTLGVVGFVLMLMTEILYSQRKRSRSSRWGRMSAWLQFHIITGLVGPYMVFLHTAWEFNGLAGVVFLLTLIIVISGFIGRYIYTAVPRTADGIEIEGHELSQRIDVIEAELAASLSTQPQTAPFLAGRMAAAETSAEKQGAQLVFGRAWSDFLDHLTWWQEKRRIRAAAFDPATRAQAVELNNLLRQRRVLRRQVESLVKARRMLSVWHAVHIPIGFALFTAAFIHIGAALYFAALLY